MTMRGANPIQIKKNSDVGILMIHGFSSTPEEFREMGEWLAEKGFTVSAPLLAGHGTHPKDLRKTCPEDWKKSVSQAYSELKKDCKKVFIVGNSFGSNLGLWLTKELNNEPAGVATLSAPIFLRYQPLILIRLYTYGFLRKYYYKGSHILRIRRKKSFGVSSYHAIPTNSLRQFLSFIKNETKPNLDKIKIPILVAQSDNDPTVNPKSAEYIYNNIGSASKELYRFFSKYHTLTEDKNKTELFEKVFDFINQVNNPKNV